jgi:hypothetical protein
MTLDESWNRYPEAKIRMRENGLKVLVDSLGPDRFCILGKPTVRLTEDGIYITLNNNVGKHPDLIAFPIDIFIPLAKEMMPQDLEIEPEGADDGLGQPVEIA